MCGVSLKDRYENGDVRERRGLKDAENRVEKVRMLGVSLELVEIKVMASPDPRRDVRIYKSIGGQSSGPPFLPARGSVGAGIYDPRADPLAERPAVPFRVCTIR
ncbi:hypothetical protein EVAR_101759_1 [Eumeta japonica]|uniref:Uncharacterized protein n=1 Tax=Eumeta variegata TaxID=151549 RepID=A0A4C1SMH7_EUMVA|nr:hypothetical protein EVAR_101759_1 [Eumeta japonica]